MPSRPSDGPVLAESSVVVLATAAHLTEIADAVARFWTELERTCRAPPDSTWRAELETAVAEIAANITRYAYPAGSAPFEMSLTLRAFDKRVEATLRDRGAPYCGPALSELTRQAEGDVRDLPEGGWGLGLAMAVVDTVSYTRGADSNQWLIVKKLREPCSGVL
jgi:anti-sigma regulatory factor (Ser/Thr protein kinase)